MNFTIEQATKILGVVEVQVYSFLNLDARWGVDDQSHAPGRFTPGKGRVPIVKEAGLAPGPVWTGVKNLAPHRDSIPGPSSP